MIALKKLKVLETANLSIDSEILSSSLTADVHCITGTASRALREAAIRQGAIAQDPRTRILIHLNANRSKSNKDVEWKHAGRAPGRGRFRWEGGAPGFFRGSLWRL